MRKIFFLIIILVPTLFLSSSKRDQDYFEISKNLRIVGSVYEKINNYYVDEVIPGELMKKGIDAMLQSLDPFTVYISEAQIEDFRFTTTGEYGGIGAIIKKSKDNVIITELYENSPAFKAGLKPGDLIIEIDNQPLNKASIQDVSNFLKGPSESNLDLKVLRKGVIKNILVTRKEIKLPSVPIHKKMNSNTGYIKLTSFTQTAASETKQALLELKKNNITNLILDLRSNGGGLLNEAVKIVNFFIPKGQLVVNTKSRIPEMNRAYHTTLNPIDTNLNLVVLIDENSASASEIVAGSLQDLDKAVILGTNSYGKGLVQQTRKLSYNSQLKLTVAKYYIPSGRCIQALDYSSRNDDGSVGKVPDSLMTSFETRNGREMKDGGGILPDIVTEPGKYSMIIPSLLKERLFFDFATDYRFSHDTILYDFEFSDADFLDFTNYISDKDYTYETATEKSLKKLKKKAEDEEYFDALSEAYDALVLKMELSKENDLQNSKGDIKEILTGEIMSRYYYQKGRIKAGLNFDIELDKAIEVLQNKAQYNKILSHE